jgi:hypothetical protein
MFLVCKQLQRLEGIVTTRPGKEFPSLVHALGSVVGLIGRGQAQLIVQELEQIGHFWICGHR